MSLRAIPVLIGVTEHVTDDAVTDDDVVDMTTSPPQLPVAAATAQ